MFLKFVQQPAAQISVPDRKGPACCVNLAVHVLFRHSVVLDRNHLSQEDFSPVPSIVQTEKANLKFPCILKGLITSEFLMLNALIILYKKRYPIF